MSDIESLIEKKSELHLECVEIKKKLLHAMQLYNSLKERYNKKRKEYETIDRKLAFLDGRYKIVHLPKTGNKTTTQLIMNLNQEQILQIAKVLGITAEEDKEDAS